MRLVFVNHCHPDTPHVCATRMREFSRAMTMRGHEVILLTELMPGMPVEIGPEKINEIILTHNFIEPLYLAVEPKGHPLIKKFRNYELPWGVRQVVVMWYFFYHKGVYTDWRTGSQLYLDSIAKSFKPDLVWATFLNTDAWNIAIDLAKIAKIPWVADIKDLWRIYIPIIFRKYLANYFDSCAALSTLSHFNSTDAQKWFSSPKTVIYSGFWASNFDPITLSSQENINISLTGGVYDDYSLSQLIKGIEIWLEGCSQDVRSKVCLTYAGNDAESVKRATRSLNSLCKISLLGFISIEDLQKLHQSSIANLYIKVDRGFHHKTIEILSAGRPIICYPEESSEVIDIADATNIAMYSCSTPEEISEALSQSLSTVSNKVLENNGLKELTWESQAKNLEQLFQTILKNSNSGSSV